MQDQFLFQYFNLISNMNMNMQTEYVYHQQKVATINQKRHYERQ